MEITGKERRQKTIEDLLSSKDIEAQDELLEMLAEQGFSITQATLSRDFREMKIAKTPNSQGQYFYRLPGIKLPQPKSTRHGLTSTFIRNGIINIEFSGQMAVIKCPAGYANGIAQDIDINNIPGIIGTIAGSDTVLVILRENIDRVDFISSLKLLFSKD